MAERNPLSEPRQRQRSLLPKVSLDSENFGEFAEAAARFMGTGKFIAYMTVFVTAWVTLNVVGIFGFRWDEYPFILLNLFFSTQASYAAPLILLAQNRQETRDKLSLDEDRRLAAQSRADMDFLAREIASIRMHLGELATRDFVRSELRNELRDLAERLEQVNERKEQS
ncbi:DUF1003 domain-containing protein [Arachnia propionica]|uniref:DUF1003 domain-containing protein n=1 Tax=Arachnia propionica TaxID=1750 RepID=A0A3P1TBF8_9ACTN|nr:DUF1003 domain-containing protein [Arachnia propionica]RRD05813.1 DUF1003 domain-containing protein [Arachnia propionica]